MSILNWPSAKSRGVDPVSRHRQPGAYAGRARFRPRHRQQLPDVLTRAVGRVIELGFAGVATLEQPFGGQSLYLEWRSDDVLDGFLIPEQDLEFLSESSDPRG